MQDTEHAHDCPVLTGNMIRPTLSALCSSLLFLIFLGGCASRTEKKKDLSVFMPGVARTAVIEELGQPVSTATSRAGTKMDVFTFVQGTAPSKKPPRPVEPEQEDATEVLALLDQFGQSPTKLLTGKKLTLQVNYDAEERVQNTVLLRMEK
jgi:hypothetical protein